MIKPASYWALHKTADPLLLGRVGIALADRSSELEPPLSAAETALVSVIKQDSDWMDERVDEQKKRWAERKREQRNRNVSQCPTMSIGQSETFECPTMSNGQSETSGCHGDISVSHDVTIHPSVPPSVRPVPKGTIKEREKKESAPLPVEMQKLYAHQLGVSDEYLAFFMEQFRLTDWAYVNGSGRKVTLTGDNFKQILSKFWNQHKRNPDMDDMGHNSPMAADTGTDLGKSLMDGVRARKAELDRMAAERKAKKEDSNV